MTDTAPAEPLDDPGPPALDAPPTRAKPKLSGAAYRKAAAAKAGAPAKPKAAPRPATTANADAIADAIARGASQIAISLGVKSLLAITQGGTGEPWKTDAQLIDGAGPRIARLAAEVLEQYPRLLELLGGPAAHAPAAQLAWELGKLALSLRANHALAPATPRPARAPASPPVQAPSPLSVPDPSVPASPLGGPATVAFVPEGGDPSAGYRVPIINGHG